MEKYYLIKGPIRFEESSECKWWIESSHWAKDMIVADHAKQDANRPGRLFKVIYKPKEAPDFIRYLRMPEDWAVEIPCFNYIERAQDEQWTVMTGPDGILNVVKR